MSVVLTKPGQDWNETDWRVSLPQADPDRPITFFAPIDSAFENSLSFDKIGSMMNLWPQPAGVLFQHLLLQSPKIEYTYEYLHTKCLGNGGSCQFDSLADKPLKFVYDESTARLQLQGGVNIVQSIKATNGWIYLIDALPLPLPRIFTMNPWKSARNAGSMYQYPLDLIESFKWSLALKNNSWPCTFFLFPLGPQDLGLTENLRESNLLGTVLKNHIVCELPYFCDDLLGWAAQNFAIQSENGQFWRVVVNELGQPCLKYSDREYAWEDKPDPPGVSISACITTCESWAWNGVVHIMDSIIMTPEERRVSSTEPTTAPTTLSTRSPTNMPSTRTSSPVSTPVASTLKPTSVPTILNVQSPSNMPTAPTSAPVAAPVTVPVATPTSPVFVGGTHSATVATSGASLLKITGYATCVLSFVSAYNSVIF